MQSILEKDNVINKSAKQKKMLDYAQHELRKKCKHKKNPKKKGYFIFTNEIYFLNICKMRWNIFPKHLQNKM